VGRFGNRVSFIPIDAWSGIVIVDESSTEGACIEVISLWLLDD
jgi:hypothetical protein